jgi:putative nucleotidyltransferase with HDIG domain
MVPAAPEHAADAATCDVAAAGAVVQAPVADVDAQAPASAAAAAPQVVLGAPAPRIADAAQRHRAALESQRQVQRQCELQFAEAASTWRRAGDQLASAPAAARETAEALARAMVDKLLIGGDVGIRLLNGAVNDRAAAHALNVTVVAMLLGRSLGLEREDLADLGLGALLHDVGKLELPERVRHLESGFGTAEVGTYRDHVARGVAAGRRMGLAEGALTVIAQHHEHADASGFPQRLAGDRITLASRILTIVNRYDNLCNPAARVAPLTPHEAVATLFAHGRSRYDAAVLNAFIRMMGVYPAGSLVQLTDDRYAMVVAANSSRPLKPRVLVHDSDVSRSAALLLDLEAEADLGIRRSLTAAKLPPQAVQYLDPRPRVAYFFEPLQQPVAEAVPA